MQKFLMGGAFLAYMIFAAGCKGPENIEAADLSTPKIATGQVNLAYESPSATEEDRASLAAPYVMANGAQQAQIAPDGSYVALSSSQSGEAQLYVVKPDGSDISQITQGAGISFFDILPSGDILYGADNDGDERENYFLYNMGTKKPKLILPATAKGFRSYGGASGDGKTIAFASTERNGLDFDIYLMDLAGGAPRLVFQGTYGNFVEAVDRRASKLIVSETVGEDADKIFVLDTETGKRTLISGPTPRANHADAGVHFLPKGNILLASNEGVEFSTLRLLRTDPRFPAYENGPLVLHAADGADIDSVENCRKILITMNRDGFSDLGILNHASTAPIKIVEGLPRGVYQVDCKGSKAVVRVSGPDIPGDIYILDLEDLTPRRIYSSAYGTLDKSALVSPTPVRMPARDGVEVQGLLYMPTGEGDPKPPVVFVVHGGPTAQGRPSFNSTIQYLLSRGIAVFQTNVRGSTGFGRTFVTLDDRRKRLDSIRDLVDMLGGLKADGRVDTQRAAVLGGSYGGYAVNAVLSEYPDAFIAGVSLYGVADWVTALEVASPALKAADLIEYGNIEDPEWRAFYTEQSPIRNVDKIKVPVLFSHGAMDPRIDISETETMVQALRANGIEAPFIRFPDEGHGWRKLDNRLYYQRRQSEFLEEVFGLSR